MLVKNAEALERLEKVTTLVVDKTGTLTEGKPKLVDVLPADGFDAKEFLRLAASLEQNSEHPLAAAIVQGAKEQSLNLEAVKDFRSVTAGGVVGTVAGRAVMVGKPDFLRNEKITGLESLEASAVKLQEEGKTAMFVAVDGKPAGILAVADPIKSTTAEAIKELHALGLKLVMLTGDNRRTADAVAKQLGLDAVEAEIEPAGKVAHVKKLRDEGKHVAMAGDGINDAPALSEAEVGIAMGTGTDVAMQSAGITLVKGDLRGIAKAIRLSRATMSNIRQNLVFAFLYNALGIPVAAGVLYPFFGLAAQPDHCRRGDESEFRLGHQQRPAAAESETVNRLHIMNTNTLTPELLEKRDAYWRAANYVSVGQMYLYDNPLLKPPLALTDIKPMLLGHWGTTPGQNFICVHLNRHPEV